MTEKKERCKFTIQFNPADPNHGQVIDLLNSQGRRKAQFIVNAVLHYLNCSETPDIPQSPQIDTKLIEAVVERIMAKQKANGNTNEVKSETKATGSQEISIDDIEDTLGEEGLNAIANTMAMFRQD